MSQLGDFYKSFDLPFFHAQLIMDQNTQPALYASAGDQVIPVDTILSNSMGASLTSSQPSLLAGKYYIEFLVCVYRGDEIRCRVDIAGSNKLLGHSFVNSVKTGGPIPCYGVLELAVDTTLELILYQSSVSLTYTAGRSVGADSTYPEEGSGPPINTEFYHDFRAWRIGD